MEENIYTYRGRVRIGFNYFLAWAAEGTGKIKFLQDKIVAYAFPFKKSIPYSKIKKLEWSHLGYIRFIHEAGGFPYVACFMIGKNDPAITKIYKILKSKGVSYNTSNKI